MAGFETSMGGSRDGFPSTAWKDLARLATGDEKAGREVLGHFVASYWRPIYVTIRRGWGKSVEDAKDLTQDFLVSLLDGDLSAPLEDPSKGRFRNWLKGALRHFLLRKKRDDTTQKRGGGARTLSLAAFEEVDSLDLPETSDEHDPSVLFDREWTKELLQRALDNLRAECIAQQKGAQFEVFRLHDLEPPPEGPPSYQTLGDALGLSVFDVGNYLKATRAAFREKVVGQISAYSQSGDEVESEIAELLEGTWT